MSLYYGAYGSASVLAVVGACEPSLYPVGVNIINGAFQTCSLREMGRPLTFVLYFTSMASTTAKGGVGWCFSGICFALHLGRSRDRPLHRLISGWGCVVWRISISILTFRPR
jgi:hypothetical protein